MGLMVPVLAGYIAYSIADRPGLAVGFTGGLLASNGNALFTDYDWGNLSGFSDFVGRFAFQGEHGGTTVSGFLGGILVGFLAGYIILGLKKLCEKLPDSLEGIKPTLIYPVVGMFIVSVLMCFIFNPIIGLINTGLSTMLTALAKAGLITLLGCLLGAMMAIDMGGPINKAAYVFGTGMLATASDLMASGAQSTDPAVQACYIAMASIMVGGMVPPIGIALACHFFPKKFTEAERASKVSNLVMGCSFITEGAIPFAASDPAHVIPCTLVGAGVAGGLSAFFGCTLMAPHGGIFVFATVGKPFMDHRFHCYDRHAWFYQEGRTGSLKRNIDGRKQKSRMLPLHLKYKKKDHKEENIMKEITYTITDPEGIHARPAGVLVKEAAKFTSKVIIAKDGKEVDAKRILGLMGLGVKCGQEIVLKTEGEDEDAAIEALGKFLEENL